MSKVRNSLVILLTVVLAVGLTGCSSTGQPSASDGSSAVSQGSGGLGGAAADPDQPARPSEIYGKVKSIEGNVVVIAEMTRMQSATDMTDEEKAAQQAKMQAMSDEERQAYRASLQALTGNNITVTVPVGVPVKLKIATTSGASVEDGTIGDIQPGKIVSIWTEAADAQSAEYVSVSTK